MSTEFDLKSTLSKRRIVGIWRMLKGYQGIYVAAFICIGLAALSHRGVAAAQGPHGSDEQPAAAAATRQAATRITGTRMGRSPASARGRRQWSR